MRSDLEVADIFRRHGHAYAQAHDGHLGRVERRVMSAIELCRTAALGGHVEACEDCAHARVAYNSCRNRHCPKCQSAARERWLADRQADLLPVPYFHVVFTVPSEVAEIAFHNKSVVYAILFDAVATTLNPDLGLIRHDHQDIDRPQDVAAVRYSRRRSPMSVILQIHSQDSSATRSPRKYPPSTSISSTYAANTASPSPAWRHRIVQDRSSATSDAALIP